MAHHSKHPAMPSAWKRYRKTVEIEARPWIPAMDMRHVRVLHTDRLAGSPKEGDMIARQPDDHEDRWLIRGEVFEATYQQAKQDGAPS